MKVSLNWLQEFVDIKDYQTQIGDLSRILTQAGLEVENIENPSADWDKVVVGHLISVDKHPDADRLTVCEVDLGEGLRETIVCGAKNHKTGDKVAAATPGACLAGNFKIKKSKIRGVASSGMLCSSKELGLGVEHDGILILPDSAPVGMPFRDYYKDVDIIFDLNVTPNRADCLSHLGLARELGTLLNRPVQWPAVGADLQSEKTPRTSELTDSSFKVQLKASDGCPRYCGQRIHGVKVADSPQWLKTRLESLGVNSINNIVDITNYVLLEYGQPLHAFDCQQLKGQQLIVEWARDGENFTSLDGTEFTLKASDLLIRDGERPVALAGVVGGSNSGVSSATQDIFLESAFFTAETVRKTARFHGIETDACYRFSRGVDPAQTLKALERATSLLLEIAGGTLEGECVDLYPSPLVKGDIEVSSDFISQRLGLNISNDDLVQKLSALGCRVEPLGASFRVSPPSYRWDLSLPEDLVEEVGRLTGYDSIGEILPPLVSTPSNHGLQYNLEKNMRRLLGGMGLYQAVNYAFIASGQSEAIWGPSEIPAFFGLEVHHGTVSLKNALSEDLAVMRESLLPGLLKNLIHNDHHGVSWGQLYEIGAAHYKKESHYMEQGRLGLLHWGQPDGAWHTAQENHNVFALKATVEGLLKKIGGKTWRWSQVSTEKCPSGFHPGQTVQLIYEGRSLGLIGTLHPQLRQKFKIRTEAAWGEFQWDGLMARQPRISKFRDLPKFPAVERDIALVVPNDLAASEVSSQVKKSAGALLESCRVFDIYQDSDLKKARQRSITFRLRFQSDKETLTDELINPLRDKVVLAVCQKLAVETR